LIVARAEACATSLLGTGYLQQTPVVVMARDDLEVHWQALGGEAARH
jgi:hypothetical protein